MERKQKAKTESLVLLIVLALICVALNALGAFGLYARKDMTQSERYTLSQGSAHLLRGMKQKMVIDAYVTKGLPKLDAFVRDLRDLLEEYKTAGGGKFDYNLIEVKDDEKKKDEAEKEGLQPLQIEESETGGDKAGIAQGYMGLVFKYGTEKDVIPVLSPDQTSGLEFWISNKIRDLHDKVDEIKHKVGVVSSDDPMKLSEPNLLPSNMGRPMSMQDVITRNFPSYSVVDVDLKNGDAPIDDTLDGLIITQPGKDLTDKELRRIDEFVMKGKSLAVLASAVNIKDHDPTMTATLTTHNLDKLLEGYGIEMHKDVVLDFGRSYRVPMMTQAGLGSVRFPQLLEVDDDPRFTGDQQLIDTAFPVVFRKKQVILPFVSSLTLHKDKQPNATKFETVMRSSPHSIVKTDDTVELGLQPWHPKGEWKQFDVAADVEGRLKTAFPTGDKQGVDAPVEVPEGKSSRVFVISAAQFTANPFARAGNGQTMQQFGGMPMGGDKTLQGIGASYADLQRGGAPLLTSILVTKNLLDWLSGDTDLLAVSAKLESDPGLHYGDVSAPKFDDNQTEDDIKHAEQEMRDAQKTTQRTVGLTLTFLAPLLFAAYGILRWRMRTNARMNVRLA